MAEVLCSKIEGFPVSKGEDSHFQDVLMVSLFYFLYCLLSTDSEAQ